MIPIYIYNEEEGESRKLAGGFAAAVRLHASNPSIKMTIPPGLRRPLRIH